MAKRLDHQTAQSLATTHFEIVAFKSQESIADQELPVKTYHIGRTRFFTRPGETQSFSRSKACVPKYVCARYGKNKPKNWCAALRGTPAQLRYLSYSAFSAANAGMARSITSGAMQ